MFHVSDEVKAKRKQFRADHYTDNDRALNGVGQVNRRAARAKAFKDQGAKSAADFDLNQYGKGHISGQEIQHMQSSGYSKNDIKTAVSNNGGQVGQRAQKKMDNFDYKKQYTDHFNKVGANAEESAKLIADYEKNTKGLDRARAFKALEGGKGFDLQGGDKQRYDALSKSDSDAAAEADKLKNSYIDTIRPGTTSNMDTAIKNTQKQNINQDNDQTSTITGDNNTVWQQQDNSIRQYGGDNRSFVYQGGNSGVDTPVSAATMAGFYDVDDSPAAQAKFLDLHNTLNNDSQKRYQGMGMRTASMFNNFDARGYDPAKLEDNLKKDEQRSYDRSTLAKLDAFGDRDAYRGTLSEYKFGAEPKAINYGDDDDDDDD